MFKSRDLHKAQVHREIVAQFDDATIHDALRKTGPAAIADLRLKLSAACAKRKTNPVYEPIDARWAVPIFKWSLVSAVLGLILLAAYWRNGLGIPTVIGGVLLLLGAIMAITGIEMGNSQLPSHISQADRQEAEALLRIAGEANQPLHSSILRYCLGAWLVLEVALAASLCASLFLNFLPFSGAISVSVALGIFLAAILHRFGQRQGHLKALDQVRHVIRNLHKSADTAAHQMRDAMIVEFGGALGYDYSEEASRRVDQASTIFAISVLATILLIALIRLLTMSPSSAADLLTVGLLGAFTGFVVLAGPVLSREASSVAGMRGERAAQILARFPTAQALQDFVAHHEQDMDDWQADRLRAIDLESGGLSFGPTVASPMLRSVP